MAKNEKTRDPYALYCDDPSLTVQSEKDECDINQIVARAVAGQAVTHVNDRVAQYGDFTNVPSYREALDLVNRADGMFKSLPAEVREKFKNSAENMIEFLQNPENIAEAEKLGIVARKKVEQVPNPYPGTETPKNETPAPAEVKVEAPK